MRNCTGLFAPTKMIIDSGPHDIVVERYIISRSDPAIDAAIEVAQINVKVFGFRGPVSRQCDFDAATDGPPRIGRARPAETGRRCADVACGQSAANKRHDTAEGVAGAAAHCREPTIACAATRASQGTACAL